MKRFVAPTALAPLLLLLQLLSTADAARQWQGSADVAIQPAFGR